MSLAGKRAIVTGAASGIGAAIAKRFAAAEADVVVADLDVDGGQQTVADIAEAGGRAELVELDVTDEEGCQSKVHELQERQRVDILVNNAGVGHVGTILETTGDDFDRLYGVNVRGLFNMSKAVLPHMIEGQHGVIINMASIAGIVGLRDRAAYTASKFAVVGLTKSMALDHAADGVRVNCICPARVETAFVKARLQEYPDPEKAYREMSATQALGRMGRPEEVADAALYLARDEASFVTGTPLIIDGGFSAGK